MPMMTVMYPHSEGGRFDMDYYTAKHITLVREHWEKHGMTDVQIMRGIAGPDGAAPTYSPIVFLTFGSMDGFKAAAQESGKTLFADIPNFTDAQPVIQFSEAV